MINYISKSGTANFRNPDSKINLDIARPLTTDQNKRAGTTNYICKDMPNNFDLQVIKEGGLYKNRQAGSIYNKNGLCPTITTEASANWNILLNDKEETLLKPEVIGGIGEKKSNSGTQWYQQDRIYNNNVGLSLSTTALPYYQDKKLRIRKLTPKECWRLMGFEDSDFNKVSQVNSNAQLYKQAGNSIVVNVLEAILKNLLS